MSEFTAGLSSRHDAAAGALRRAFADRPIGFAPADLIARIDKATEAGPKHFSPADPAKNPTEGWDPLDPSPQPSTFVDPVAVAHAAGYEEGVAATSAAITEAGQRDQVLLSGLIEQLQAGDRIDRDKIAQQLRETVMMLVRRVVGEVGVSADLLAGRIETASELLANAAESAILRVNPEDVDLLDGRLPKTIFPVGDATVARGSFVLEAASTIVEDGPALWLDQLAQAIDRAPVPTT